MLDGEGNTIFLSAFLANRLDIAWFCVEHGASINTRNKAFQFALKHAVNQNNMELVEQLLEKGADPNTVDEKGRSVLHYAVNNSANRAQGFNATFDLEALLISYGGAVSARDKRGRTPLHYAFVRIGSYQDCSTSDPVETVSSLCVAKDVDPNIQDCLGKTPLHYAAQRAAFISTTYLI